MARIAAAMEPEGDATLSFCRPGEPYVGHSTDRGSLARALEAFGPTGKSILTVLEPALKRAR